MIDGRYRSLRGEQERYWECNRCGAFIGSDEGVEAHNAWHVALTDTLDRVDREMKEAMRRASRT